jgi:hypothetical protein
VVNCPRQALLTNILGILAIGHQVATEAIERVGVAAQENIERLLVPTLEAPDELGVGQVAQHLGFNRCVHRRSSDTSDEADGAPYVGLLTSHSIILSG